MDIEFSVNNPVYWLEQVANKFGVEIVNNTLLIPRNLGEGFLRHYYLSDAFTLNYLHFKLIKPIVFSRREGNESGYSPIVFYINEKLLEQDIEDTVRSISAKSSNGIFWPSSQISTQWKFPVNEWVSNITIAINHRILQDKLKLEEGNIILQLLNSSKPFYIFEEITPVMMNTIREIIDVVEQRKHELVEGLYLEGKVIELVSLYFEKLIERPLDKKITSINLDDVEKLFKIKEILTNNISDIPCIKEISNYVGMSVTKMQKIFKQVFGKSIYQYYLYERMLLARKMLLTRKYTVSEVGYDLGYSNLSHFTKAFYNAFGINPKEFTKKNRN